MNDVIRDVFFVDHDLCTYMMIPEQYRENIVKFIDDYFIRDPSPDEIISNEDVRVCYYRSEGRMNGYHVLKRYLYFDVFVKREHLYDCGNDRLKSRIDVICQRIKELLIGSRYTCNIEFEYEDGPFELYTKLIGYRRGRIVFSYKTTF